MHEVCVDGKSWELCCSCHGLAFSADDYFNLLSCTVVSSTVGCHPDFFFSFLVILGIESRVFALNSYFWPFMESCRLDLNL